MSTTTTPRTMADFLHTYPVTLTAEHWHENPHMSDVNDMDHWKVTLRLHRRRLTCY